MKLVRVGVLISAAVCSVAQNAPAGGTVEGTVLNSVTGAGIDGAMVTLFGATKYQTKSDVAGHFKITGITPGNYRTTVDKDGFWQTQLDLGSFLSSPGLRIDSELVKMELKLAPFETIRGRVLSPDGEPLAGVEVSVSPNITANEVVTDAQGRFALEDTRPGSYTLIAKPPESTKQGEDRIAMVKTYYPSVADKSLAQQIVIGGQPNSANYEIRMQTAPVYRVRGIVLDETGKPSPGAELALIQIPEGMPGSILLGGIGAGGRIFALGMRRAPSGAPEATAIAKEDGRFEFPAVRSGNWRVDVVSDDGVTSRGAISVSVARSDVADLQIHSAKLFTLRGTAEWKSDDAGRVSNTQPPYGVVTLVDPESGEVAGRELVASGGVSFEFMLPGRYKAVVKPGLSAQIFLGDYEVTGQTFPISANGPRLRVVLKTWSGSVRGTVEKGEGATVVLIPQRIEGITLGQTAVCGPGGSFELTEVSPGDYYIAAFEHLDRNSPPSSAMLGLVPSRGTSVKVEERSSANVTLSVIALPR
jgi:hypothetical protein